MKGKLRITISLLFIVIMTITACAPAATPTPAPAQPSATAAVPPAAPTATKPLLQPSATAVPTVAASKYKEAPALAEMVKGGKLPEVTKRLPDNPMVVKPVEKVGQYGGSWRMGAVGGNDSLSFGRIMAYEPLLRWTADFDGYLPNVAESFVGNADGSEYTVKLRKGMKWSDGQPFTTADIRYWYEDVLLNKNITAKPDNIYVINGKVFELEVVDEITFKFKFAGPYGFFPMRMAQSAGPVSQPAHYLKQFHPKYTPEAEKKAADAGAKSWVEYYLQKATYYANVELPTLYPWNLTSPYGSASSILTAERNPYYWKVDTEGNQLPYIDKLQYTIHQSVDTLTLQALNGEIDMQYRHFGTLNNKSIFFDNQQKGNYRLVTVKTALANSMCIYPTLTTKDPAVRALLNNKDFRIGLSYAINREEIIDLIYLGQATPQQVAPHVDGPFANKQMAYQYTEFDLAKANEHLDKAGLTKKDAEGYRLRPDGKRVTLTAEIASIYPTQGDAMELVKATWKEVGVDLNVKLEDRSIQWERKAANETELFLWAAGGGGGLDVMLNAQAYFPERSAAWFAPAWGDWYASGGAKGEEPDAEMKKMMELYQKLQTISDFNEQVKMMKEILQISADYFPCICLSNDPDLFAVVTNKMHNVPKTILESATINSPAPTNPEQYYITE